MGDAVCASVAVVQDDAVCASVAVQGDVVCASVAVQGDVVCASVVVQGDAVCASVAVQGDAVCASVAVVQDNHKVLQVLSQSLEKLVKLQQNKHSRNDLSEMHLPVRFQKELLRKTQ
jgi:hypothetical protein